MPGSLYLQMKKFFQGSVFLLISLNFASQGSASGVCQENAWTKKGCRKDFARDMVLLFSDRNPKSKIKIDWDHWQPYLLSLACRCATVAKRQNLQWFALQYYGECWSKNGSLSQILPRYRIDRKCGCVGETFKSCKLEDRKSLCVGKAFRAYFYELTDQQKPACGGYECNKAVDVALVIDASGSMSQVTFNIVIQFLKLLVDRFDFPNSGTRFALITYDHEVTIELMLEDSALCSLQELKGKISQLKYTGGATLTDLALKAVKERIFKRAPRVGVPRTCIIMTDGKTYGGSEMVIKPAEDLRSLGVSLMAIGVGDQVDTLELQYIAGENVILMTSYDEVLEKANNIIDQLTRGACRNVYG